MRSGAPRGHGRLAGVISIAASVLITFTSLAPAQADSIRSRQWHLDAMKADEMWKVSRGEGITVAVIDTGVDTSLPDLQGQVLEGKDFSHQAGGAHADAFNHGTQMAALIAGTGRRGDENGSFGLAPAATILPLRVFDGTEAKNAAESVENYSTAMSEAIRYAADSNAQILNISMGQARESEKISTAVQYALAKGKLIFAAVGNSGDKGNEVEYPAAVPGVVGVAAVDADGVSTNESQRGPQVDLAAPGDGIITACTGGTQLCTGHGTSDATALTSASAALIWSVHPTWTANQVLRVLINTAGGPKDGQKRSDAIGYGVVRPRIALQNPGDPGPADVSPLPGADSGAAAGAAKREASGAEASSDGSLFSTRNVLVGGIGAGVVVAVVCGLVFARRRGRS